MKLVRWHNLFLFIGMPSNVDIGRLFSLFAELLLLHNKDERLAALLSGAAYRIPRLNVEVTEISKAELGKLFRPEIIRFLSELNTSGTINELDGLIQLTPAGLFEMMRIRGLGGKKLFILWKEAKIDSLDMLLVAAKKDQLTKIKGFGKKTQSNIIAAIEAYRSNVDRFHYASVADTADILVKALQQNLKLKLISLCGEVRRRCTTVASIEIIAAIGKKRMQAKSTGKFLIIQTSNSKETIGHTIDEVPVHIYHTTKKNFYLQLFRLTGNDDHVKKVISKLKDGKSFSSEEDIYKKAKLRYVVPEMRENVAEWAFPKKGCKLIEPGDIKGVVHNHTDWSDGVDSLPDFVSACKKKKYEYVVISDHSKNAHYAGGLKEEKVLRQLKDIDILNNKYAPFHIFKSIECDILISGELDYDKGLLSKFDLVIVSIHQLLKMDEEKATKRLIKAIENPFTTILGHMTGRQLLIRPGYPVNYTKVIDACAANGVVIEINANPYRLDMDWLHIPYALNKGVMISINPDAHSISEIDNIRWGVYAARKGGLTKDMTRNAMDLASVKRWLKERRL
jgi:DNA polymerase (family 10)